VRQPVKVEIGDMGNRECAAQVQFRVVMDPEESSCRMIPTLYRNTVLGFKNLGMLAANFSALARINL
jgi:hypothetical protein